MAHSKRNTSLAFFTAHERSELKGIWGSRSSRLTRESFVPFGHCRLCLLPAREPVACGRQAHLFCRECAVSNLLAQNAELKRQRKAAERRRGEDAAQREDDDAAAKAQAVEEFEKTQAGLKSEWWNGEGEKRKKGGQVATGEAEGAPRRKRRLDEHGDGGDDDERERAKKRTMSSSKETELPSFWVPSETPENQRAELKAVKQHPTCPAANPDQPHELSLKTLVTVRFNDDSESTASNQQPAHTCPSCNRTLSNASKAVLAKPCGHVLCKSCSDRFQQPVEKSAHDKSKSPGEQDEKTILCYVCQEDVTPGRQTTKGEGGKESKLERGLVELSCEGTGFAGGGKSMVTKDGVVFQC